MKTLTSMLNEKVTGVQWLEHSLSQVESYMFPLTTSIAKELGIGRTITAIHFTSPQKAMRLQSMQGSEKSISVMTRVPEYTAYYIEGVWEKGVIYKVQGKVLMASAGDIGSGPDQRGRRWIGLDRLRAGRYDSADKYDEETDTFSNEDASALNDQYKQFLNSNPQYKQLRSQLGDSIEDLDPQLLGKQKKLVSLHFDLSLQFVKKYRDLFDKILPDPSIDKITTTGDYDWNEIVVNHVKLLEVAYNIEHPIFNTSGGAKLKDKLINSVPRGKAKPFRPKDWQIIDWIKQ